MSDTERVRAWRQRLKEGGLVPMTIWVKAETKARYEDLALQSHRSGSELARNTAETLELGERLAKAGADLASLSENSILKFFQVDSTGMFRMTSSARYFKKGVGSSRPNWRWIMCFVERPKANTSCTAWVKRFSFS